jgi:uncharacterized membrane protein YdfJ with MMPL/SSD domain
MLYQEYKTKVRKRMAMRRTLRKYRVPIIAALAVLALLFALFALTKGMVGD